MHAGRALQFFFKFYQDFAAVLRQLDKCQPLTASSPSESDEEVRMISNSELDNHYNMSPSYHLAFYALCLIQSTMYYINHAQ